MQRLAVAPTENPLKRPARLISGHNRAVSDDEGDDNKSEDGVRDGGKVVRPRTQRPHLMPWQRPRRRSDLPPRSWAERDAKLNYCCEKCSAMTGTREGLAALLSNEGYEHHNWYDIQESANKSCGLCDYMWELLEGGIWDSDDEGEEDDGDGYGITRKAIRVFAQLEDLEALRTSHDDFRNRHPLDGPRMYSLLMVAPVGNDPPEVFYLVTAPDDLAARYVAGRLGSRTLGDVEVAAIRSWLAEEYKLENRASPPELPTRVIDVEPNSSSAACRIYQAQNQERAQYAALSYCWGQGGAQQVTSTRCNIADFSRELPTTSLSATARDAIQVCRKIGLRFLWIDALCIVQDDDNDKLDQIARMGSIYKNATLTIVAACAETAAAGFLSSENNNTTTTATAASSSCVLPFYIDDHTSGTVSIRGSDGAESTLATAEPLFRRGWTFQEIMLSRRMLVFDTKQMTMKSMRSAGSNYTPVVTTHVEFETEIPDLPLTVFGIDNKPTGWRSRESRLAEDQNDRWPRMVQEYSGRDLTVWTDRLPALAGIAAELALAWDDTYLAGLWHRTLVQHLGWIREKHSCVDIPEPAAIRPRRLAGPSWSWATVPHRVALRPVSKPDAKLISYHVQPTSGRSPFGQVDSAHIVLDALLIPPPPLKFDEESMRWAWHCGSPDGTTPSIWYEEDLCRFGMDVEEDGHQLDTKRLWLLYLGEVLFLVIAKLESGRFRRLGHAELRDVHMPERLRIILTLGKRDKVILE
ncbi:heterokaryon incompatibility protein-domain-containing protein [Immersiella caudata]|uniref:Heterokaryon incompatibility protein-domain-containing protein n=1 Tax=Immersiella caudata TaxID=314043 RepID=A0AA39WQ88_9PEZI|nr:heterokaryon incompatibility protein-domain-containing protein [Immersiella caudata]